jgi:hypothetical protein
VGQRSSQIVPDNARIIDWFLIFDGRGCTVVRHKVRLARSEKENLPALEVGRVAGLMQGVYPALGIWPLEVYDPARFVACQMACFQEGKCSI